MTGFIKHPLEVPSQEFKIRLPIRTVCFPPTLFNCTGTGTEQVKN